MCWRLFYKYRSNFEIKFRCETKPTMSYRSILHLLLLTIMVSAASTADLNGIYVLDSCDCHVASLDEPCDLKGPFIFDQQRSSVAIRQSTTQIGVGSVDNDDRLDIYLNKNRCKGLWKNQEKIAELKCQHSSGAVCLIKLRCASGTCQHGKGSKDTMNNAATTTAAHFFIAGLCFFQAVFLPLLV